MPHITLEYSSNIEGDLTVSDLLRAVHDQIESHNIDAYKIKSRAIKLTDYIIGDEAMHTSMVHVNCLLLAGRPAPFGANLSKDIFATLQNYIDLKTITKCSVSVEVRDMDADTYTKQQGT